MKALTVALLVAVAILAWEITWQRAMILNQQRQLDTVNAELTAKPKVASLELQEKCAKQAYEGYKQAGWEKQEAAGFENHYSEKLGKCFMVIENTDAKTSPGTIWQNKTVVDAFEGRVVGSYLWHTEKDKKYWEVPPFQCDVTLPSGEKKICKSSDEFEQLVKVYMES